MFRVHPQSSSIFLYFSFESKSVFSKSNWGRLSTLVFALLSYFLQPNIEQCLHLLYHFQLLAGIYFHQLDVELLVLRVDLHLFLRGFLLDWSSLVLSQLAEVQVFEVLGLELLHLFSLLEAKVCWVEFLGQLFFVEGEEVEEQLLWLLGLELLELDEVEEVRLVELA